MTLAELGRRMSSAEYASWLAYDQVEPIGELGAWWRTGVVAATVANNAFGRKRRNAKPLSFMPILDQRQSPEQIRAVFEGVAARVRAKSEAARQREGEGARQGVKDSRSQGVEEKAAESKGTLAP